MKPFIRILFLSIAILLIYVGFEWVPSWTTQPDYLILIAFTIGILVSICALQVVYAFSNFQSFRNSKTSDFSNPLIEFILKMFIPLAGVSIITLLCIHYLLRKPVIDFKDGKASMALKENIRAITTHRNVKYEVHVRYLTENNERIETYDMLFKEELKYIQELDSLPIVYSASNPKKISIITTEDKLRRIKEGR